MGFFEELKRINWHKLDKGIVDISIKGKRLEDVYNSFSNAKEEAYNYCRNKMYQLVDKYSFDIINYGITGNNCMFFTFKYLLRDFIGYKYLIVETAYNTYYFTTNDRLLKACREIP